MVMRVTKILCEVAQRHGFSSPSAILAKNRTKKAVQARVEAMRLLREVQIKGKPMSFPAIGRRLGLNHSTVYIHLCPDSLSVKNKKLRERDWYDRTKKNTAARTGAPQA